MIKNIAKIQKKGEAMATIAFDLDDVIYPFASNILKFYNLIHRTKFTLKDYTDYHLEKVLGCSLEEALALVVRYTQSDFARNLPPIHSVFDVLTRFKERHHKLIVITARWTPDRREWAEDWNEKFLPGIFAPEDLHFIVDHEIDGRRICKSELCKELKVDCLVDDRYLYVERTAQIGINAILFQPDDYLWNTVPRWIHPRIYITKNWSEIERTINQLFPIYHRPK